MMMAKGMITTTTHSCSGAASSSPLWFARVRSVMTTRGGGFNRVKPHFLKIVPRQLMHRSNYCTSSYSERLSRRPSFNLFEQPSGKIEERYAWMVEGQKLKEEFCTEETFSGKEEQQLGYHVMKMNVTKQDTDEQIKSARSSNLCIGVSILPKQYKSSEFEIPKESDQTINGRSREVPSSTLPSDECKLINDDFRNSDAISVSNQHDQAINGRSKDISSFTLPSDECKLFDDDLRNSDAHSVNKQLEPKGNKSKQVIVKRKKPASRAIVSPSLKPLDGSKKHDLEKAETDIKLVEKKVSAHNLEDRERLSQIFEKVLIVDDKLAAENIVKLLTVTYKDLVHACDTEVSKIDVKRMTPVNHGEVICFSIYSGPGVDFGNGKSCIWVDVLKGGKDVLMAFRPFFENSSIKKIWHNYSFDSHVLENYGIQMSGFHADTMHMARLWDSSRQLNGGYGLEALSGDKDVMSGAKVKRGVVGTMKGNILKCGVKADVDNDIGEMIGKISMKTIFGTKKAKKDGTDGKVISIANVEELQTGDGDRRLWICYSALDSISTLRLFGSLKEKLENMKWVKDNRRSDGNMFDFYLKYWQPFGEILVKMETEGFLVDREYLEKMKEVAARDKKIAEDRFRRWASRYCPGASLMNIGSGTQLRQLFYGGTANSKKASEILPNEKTFKVPNDKNIIEEGKKVARKFIDITLHKIGGEIESKIFTPSGWPSTSGDALKTLAGKVSSEYCWLEDDVSDTELDEGDESPTSVILGKPLESADGEDLSLYGEAYGAFGGGKEGKEACHAIAALCELASIDKMLSNFFIPLLSDDISGSNKRIHCSLNINTETGRLSARRPNLQNQPALEKDRYKIRQAFIAAPGNSLVVADYGQLELRILAHLADCKSMKEAFEAGGDFHSRTAMLMYDYIQKAVNRKEVMLEWYPQPGQEKSPVPLLKDAFASERRKAKMLNFSIAYGKTPIGLARDWKVSEAEAKDTVNLWYKERQEVLKWQEDRKKEAREIHCVHTLLGRARRFPAMATASYSHKRHIERAAINTPVQGSAADVAMCAMLEISRNSRLKELGWRLLLQVHDEVILEGPTESAEEAKNIVVKCMSKPFDGVNNLKVDLAVDAKFAQNWYAAK